MATDLSAFVANPLHQALLGIPISVVGNLTTDGITKVWQSLSSQPRSEQLENLLLDSFLKALALHGHQYDAVAKRVTDDLRVLVARRKNEFLRVLRSVGGGHFVLPPNLSEPQVEEFFIRAFMDAFSDLFCEEQRPLIRSIVRDACGFYCDAFFEHISQEQQLWLVFREALKIESIPGLIRTLERNLPTREQFESIRAYVLQREPTPERIEQLERSYLDYLLRKFSTIELKGVSPRVRGQDISFDLDDVFIPMAIRGEQGSSNVFAARHQYEYQALLGEHEPLREQKAALLAHLEQFPRIVLLVLQPHFG